MLLSLPFEATQCGHLVYFSLYRHISQGNDCLAIVIYYTIMGLKKHLGKGYLHYIGLLGVGLLYRYMFPYCNAYIPVITALLNPPNFSIFLLQCISSTCPFAGTVVLCFPKTLQ